MEPRVVSHADDLPPSRCEAGDLAVLDDVDAARVGGAGDSPRRPRRAARRRRGAAARRRGSDSARRASVEDRHHCLDLLAASGSSESMPFSWMALTRRRESPHVVQGVRQVQHAALAEHHVVVQILATGPPTASANARRGARFVPQVVGADDRGVAAGIAAAEPALLQHRDIGDAVLLGEVVGGREPMAAAADDDDVVFRAWAPGCARPRSSSRDS